jgi:hypothetical protein
MVVAVVRTSWYKDEADNVAGHRTSKSVTCRIRIPNALVSRELVVFIERMFVVVCCCG